MTSVAFVDSNIPIYAAGREHQYKEPCARIIRAIANNPGHFMTDAEALQELMHHYRRTNRWTIGREIFRRFETLLQGRIEPTYPEDVNQAARTADEGHQSSSRDLVHASVMRRCGASFCISADTDFDRIPGVRRLDPMQLDVWLPELGVNMPPSQDAEQ